MTRQDLSRRLAGLQVAYSLGELSRREYAVLRAGARVAYRLEKPTRRKARRKVQTAVAAGELARPSCCEDCGGYGPVEGHHADYSKPLFVVWLCPRCHTLADRAVVVVTAGEVYDGLEDESGAGGFRRSSSRLTSVTSKPEAVRELKK